MHTPIVDIKCPVKCLHPRRITVNGSSIVVGCGKCEPCLSRKFSKNNLRCQLEVESSSQSFHVVLSFANKHLPFLRVSQSSSSDSDGVCDYVAFNTCKRVRDFLGDDYLGSFRYSSSLMEDLLVKVMHDSRCRQVCPHGYVPFLFYRDIDLFLKRLRIVLKRFGYEEKIRYYCVGEYGPVSFRPHWHLLFFLSKKVSPSFFLRCLYKAWPYGTVSLSKVGGATTPYVTSYATSSFVVPPLFDLPVTKPRMRHSINFGVGFFRDYKKAATSRDFMAFVDDVRFLLSGTPTKLRLRWLLENRLFPKCSAFGQKTLSARFVSYNLYPLLSCYYGDQPLKDLSRLFVTDVFRYIKGRFHPLPYLSDAFDLYSEFLHSPFSLSVDNVFDVNVDYVYRDLLVSRNCIKYYVGSLSCSSSDVLAITRLISDYYSFTDYYNLCSSLTFQEVMSNDGSFSFEMSVCSSGFPTFMHYCYDNLFSFSHIEKSHLYCDTCKSSVDKFYDNRKHKAQNEANDLFCYDNFKHGKNYSFSSRKLHY